MAANKNPKQEPQEKLQAKIKEKSIQPITDIESLLKKGKKAGMPEDLKPMLATLVGEPFSDPEWVYEVKWDGYRTIAYLNGNTVDLRSRNNKSFTEKYYSITEALEGLNLNAVIDGEIVVLNNKGASDFSSLQNWRSEADGELVFYAFDLLWYKERNLMGLPLTERHAILEQIFLTDDDRLRISNVFTTNGIEFFEAAKQIGLEGIIAKKSDSIYNPDVRTKEWLKIKADKRQEVVIGGFTRNEDSSKPFSSLLLGVYRGKEFHYVGKVGTGFSVKNQKEMMAAFQPLIIKETAFTREPDVNKS
ncbi:non-homologous end-joining DNA ligase [Chryseobacterium sp. Alg-005]